MKKFLLFVILLILLASLTNAQVFAQEYSFNLQEGIVDLFINSDGTARIEYNYRFQNDSFGAPIEFVDLAFPSYAVVEPINISATIDGQPVSYISLGEYQGEGQGVAIALGEGTIPAGQSGTFNAVLDNVKGLVFQDNQDPEYASFEFSPAYFSTANGTTSWIVSFHLPEGVQPEEPRWHASPSGWPPEPETYLDEKGRVTYTWINENARGDREYQFGVSFPSRVLPTGVVRTPDVAQALETSWETIFNFGIWFCCFGFFGVIIFLSYRSTTRRKLQYLPPKIAIEGHGIKRGLTAVEAALLLEQPMDKILTMILFSVIKKGAAEVVTKDPLDLKVDDPLPEGLYPYEEAFLKAFKTSPASRKKELQQVMIDLIQNLSNKMKGFSRKETVAYYQDIVKKAWTQVEAAETPEVKSEKYNEMLEWTMLDKDYDDRTRRVFGPGPVFVPVWWGRYDPTYRPSTSIPQTAAPSAPSGGGFTTPTLPGSAFAGSIVGGVQNFSSKVVGSISDFTGSITNKTNPVPVSSGKSYGGSRSGGGSSCACACACACAGCACACAGGGR